MGEIIACCGFVCSDCMAYQATVNDDDALREKTAEMRKRFIPDIKPEDINCLGCNSGVLFGHCKVCEIRACCHEHELENCGACDSFACGKLDKVFQYAPDARERLERLNPTRL